MLAMSAAALADCAPGRFVLGVEWHPEYALSEGDTRIFAAFVAAARR